MENYIEISKIKILWHCNYYDGPISGVLEYNNNRYWFEQYDDFLNHPEMVSKWVSNTELDSESQMDWCRRYKIYKLSSSELKELEEDHELFKKYVGTHTDHNSEGNRQIREIKPQSEWNKYYDEVKDRPIRKYDVNTVIGWFEI